MNKYNECLEKAEEYRDNLINALKESDFEYLREALELRDIKLEDENAVGYRRLKTSDIFSVNDKNLYSTINRKANRIHIECFQNY